MNTAEMKTFVLQVVLTLAVALDSTKTTAITISKPPETLYILSLLPYPDTRPGFQPSWDEGHRLFLAGQQAVADINNRTDILSEYVIELLEADSGCDVTGKAEIAFVENVLCSGKQIVGMVGTHCSHSADVVSTLNAEPDISLINIHISNSPLLTDRAKYPNSFGVLGSPEVLAEASSALILENNWLEIAILFDQSTVSIKEVLQQTIKAKTGTDIVMSSIMSDARFPLDELRESDFLVGFVLLSPHLLNNLLCLLYHEGLLFPKYQWVILNSAAEVTSTEFVSQGKQYLCNSTEMDRTIEGIVIMQYDLTLHNGTFAMSTDTTDVYTKAIFSDDNSEVKGENILGIAGAHYDAIWCLLLALNNSVRTLAEQNLSDYKYGNADITSSIREQVLKLDFEGMSGRINFEKNTGFVKRMVNIHQVINGTMGLVAHYNDNHLVIYEGATFIVGDYSEPRIIVLYVPLWIAVPFFILLAVALIALVISQIMTVICQNYRSIKATSTKLSHLAYIGCYLIITATVSYLLVKTFELNWDSRCVLYHVLTSGSFFGGTLIFGTMCARTWRLYRIYVHFQNPGKLISDKILFLFVVFLSLYDAIVTIIWVLVDPRSPVSEAFTDGDTILIRETCESKCYFVWLGLFLAFNTLLMFCALALALRCYHIPHKDFNTKSIILTVYLLAFILALGLAVYYTLPREEDIIAECVVLCVMLILILYVCVFFFFLPPFIPLLKLRIND